MHSFEVHSNESACRKKFCLGLEQVVIITSACLKIRHTLWRRKSETIIYKIIHNSPPLGPYLPKIYQALLEYQKNLFTDLVGQNFYTQEVLYGASSSTNGGILIYYDNKMNSVYYGTTLKLVLHLHPG